MASIVWKFAGPGLGKFVVGEVYQLKDSQSRFSWDAPKLKEIYYECIKTDGKTASFKCLGDYESYENVAIYKDSDGIEEVTLYVDKMVETSYEYFENVWYYLSSVHSKREMDEIKAKFELYDLNESIKYSLVNAQYDNTKKALKDKVARWNYKQPHHFEVGVAYKAVELDTDDIRKDCYHLKTREILAECLCIEDKKATFLIVDGNPRILDFNLHYTDYNELRHSICIATPVQWDECEIERSYKAKALYSERIRICADQYY